tara:strand:+ start:554 stop:1048 length:495 start_codon:yes stop_codon:yes gene_type:complete
MPISSGVNALALVGTSGSAEAYSVDSAHSSLAFSVHHLGTNNVKGRFDEFVGMTVIDKGAIDEAHSTMQLKSFDTDVQQRNDHPRSPDFTVRGVPKELRLPVKLSDPIKDQKSKLRIGLVGKLEINRNGYGIKFNTVLETAVTLVGEEVSIEVNLEAVQQTDDK